MKKITTLVQTLVGGFFVTMGVLKLSPSGGPDAAVFERLGIPRRLLEAAGMVNVAAGAGMLIGLRRPAATVPAGITLCAYLLLAIRAALARDGETREAVRLATILVVCAALVAAARSGRR